MFATLLTHHVPDAPASGTLDPRPRSCLTLPAPFPPRRLPSQPCSCPCPCAFPPSFSVPMPFGRPSLAKCTVVPQPKHLCLLRTSSACPASPSLLICLCIHVEGFLVASFSSGWRAWWTMPFRSSSKWLSRRRRRWFLEVASWQRSICRCFLLGKCGLLTAHHPTAGPLFSWRQNQLRLFFLE